jgi:hypothetical protein
MNFKKDVTGLFKITARQLPEGDEESHKNYKHGYLDSEIFFPLDVANKKQEC